jgi:large subunit ribosomal protein L31
MKKNLHPEIHEVTARCACGYSFPTLSTASDLRATICSHCHPFFTGAQKFLDTAGRIEKFEQRYKKADEAKAKVEAQKEKAAAAVKAAAAAKVVEKKKPAKKKTL